MIKITYYSNNYCTVLFEVDPYRPARIWEAKLGMAIAKRSDDYYISVSEKQDIIYRQMTSISTETSVEKLKIMKKDAQEKFSDEISMLKRKLEDFKLLQELTKKEVKKNGNK